MGNKWDTIIIGAGLGGLTAAAKLVRAGRRVLVLERNPHPGGTAYVYNRKGFSFPMGPLGFSHPGLVRSILKDLEVGDDLSLHRVHYRIRAFDCDVPLSLPPAGMVKALSERFPSDAQGRGAVLSKMKAILSSSHHHLMSSTDGSASEYLTAANRGWEATPDPGKHWDTRTIQRPSPSRRHVESDD